MKPHTHQANRRGKILVVFAIILPALLGIIGVVVDSGLLMAKHRELQNIADAAATAAAMDLLRGLPKASAVATARAYVKQHNNLACATVSSNSPPREGAYAGNPDYIQVAISHDVRTHLIQVLGGSCLRTVRARAVAGFEPTTDGAAVVVLDPDPNQRKVSAGLDIFAGAGLSIHGAVLVNNEWGGLDEEGNPAGHGPGAPYAVRSLGSGIRSRDLRVTGGVDNHWNYTRTSLKANKLPVTDPLQDLVVPTLNADGINVRLDEFRGVKISGEMPGRGRDRGRTLQPGVYDWIEVTQGSVTFQPGVYIIRNVRPRTGIGLNLQGGTVTAEGVMFYLTNSPRYSPANGLPDALDEACDPPSPSSGISAVINVNSRSRFTPLRNESSPFNGILLFQRRHDPRLIVISQWQPSSSSQFGGHVYARWGRVLLRFRGRCRASFVTGSMQIVSWGGGFIQPLQLLPPAQDVFLVE